MSRRFRICMAKGGRESARPSYGRPKWTLISRGKKIPKTVLQKTFRPQFSRLSLAIESAVFHIYQNTADQWLFGFGQHRRRWFFLSRNKGQLRAAVTWPCRLSTLLCHTYSEMSGHADSPGGTQNIPYVFKNLSKSINFLEHLQMTRIHVKIYFDQVKIIFQNQFRNTQKN